MNRAFCRIRPALIGRACVWLLVGVFGASSVAAQERRQGEVPDSTAKPKVSYRISPVVVTATLTEKNAFDVPKPVSVLSGIQIRERTPNNAADLLRTLPGLDVTGVGVNQVRPSIRGQRGQRILLLEDGMRLSNSRRQQSFGEIPGIVDVTSLERIEIVRGPASVLYGTDAIGGVINLITRRPTEEGVHGSGGYRYSSQDGQHKGMGSLYGRLGSWAFRAKGTVRDAGSYRAPTGSFGDIRLDSNTTVFDTGTKDYNLESYLGYELSGRSEVFGKYERYHADTSGFGYVDPAAYAPDQPFIRILYPDQSFDKFTLGYRGADLDLVIADRLDVVGYYQRNQRRLSNDVFVSFGIPNAPEAGVSAQSFNNTNLATFGARLEASKLAGSSVMLTYGLDMFRDRSENSDSSVTTVFGFGPPEPEVSTVPLVPYASYLSAGAFLQADWQFTSRGSVILSGRYQYTRAASRETPGLTDTLQTRTYNTLVGAANVMYEITPMVMLVGSVGRAFRAPNLVEQFFNGLTPEGAAYQVPNPDLSPESSLNFDLGARYRNRYMFLEAFWFRNEIRDGIRIAQTGDSLNGLPMYSNVNVDKLRFTGVEVSADVMLPIGMSVGGSYTHLSTKDVLNENNPVGDSYGDKFQFDVGYRNPSDRFWVEYNFRHNGERKDSELSGPLGTSPIGPVLPAFTVHSVRGGVTLFRRGGHTHRVGVVVSNLTDALYAEFSNAGFFRPESRRGVTLTYDVSF
jgi:hemoglobin/transferrin/lactoferrin receptor protein